MGIHLVYNLGLERGVGGPSEKNEQYMQKLTCVWENKGRWCGFCGVSKGLDKGQRLLDKSLEKGAEAISSIFVLIHTEKAIEML